MHAKSGELVNPQSSPVGFQPTKTASIGASRSMSREAVWFDFDFK